MKGFLLDENLSKRMIDNLLPLFTSVTHVQDIAVTNFFDAEIWAYARKEEYVIISKDNDFLHLSNLFGCPPKVIRLGCGNKTTSYITQLLKEKYPIIQTFVGSEDCYMEIV